MVRCLRAAFSEDLSASAELGSVLRRFKGVGSDRVALCARRSPTDIRENAASATGAVVLPWLTPLGATGDLFRRGSGPVITAPEGGEALTSNLNAAGCAGRLWIHVDACRRLCEMCRQPRDYRASFVTRALVHASHATGLTFASTMSRMTAAQVVQAGDYLQPDFEPSSLTVNQLLGVFGYHNIMYPTTYTKPKLLQLFNETIKANRTQLMKERLKRQNSDPSDDGITDGVTGQLLTERVRPGCPHAWHEATDNSAH